MKTEKYKMNRENKKKQKNKEKKIVQCVAIICLTTCVHRGQFMCVCMNVCICNVLNKIFHVSCLNVQSVLKILVN